MPSAPPVPVQTALLFQPTKDIHTMQDNALTIALSKGRIF
ncbi:ATP phosphoribosyltransferase, partial [Neisseria gonorrhoeae]